MEVFLVKKTFLFLLIGTWLLSGCSSLTKSSMTENPSRTSGLISKKDIPQDYIPKDIKVVMLGDSLTEGVGDQSKKGGYLPYLEELLLANKGINKAEIVNFGVSGHRTTQLIKRMEKDEVRSSIKEADMILITIGGNDVMSVVKENFSNLTIEDFDRARPLFNERLQQILKEIRNQNTVSSIVVIGLYNPFSFSLGEITEINQVISEWNKSSQDVIAKDDNAYFVEIADLFQGDVETLLHTDFFHPNNQGYELIAERVYHVLNRDVLDQIPNKVYVVNKQESQSE